jgi:hypothetical protein
MASGARITGMLADVESRVLEAICADINANR